MDTLRKPFFVAAMLCIIVVVAIEMGAGSLLAHVTRATGDASAEIGKQLDQAGLPADEKAKAVADANQQAASSPPRPGFGIKYLALLDGLIVFTAGLIALPLLVSDRVVGRVQGIATLLVSLLVLFLAILGIISAIVLVMVMVSLFVAVPFGTIAYLIVWGFFNSGGAAATLGLLLTLKIGFAVCLVLAQPGFLKNKGLVLIVLTSLLGNLVVSFLHALVPGILVSITDMIAAIVVAILAALWAIFLLVGSIIAIVKAVA